MPSLDSEACKMVFVFPRLVFRNVKSGDIGADGITVNNARRTCATGADTVIFQVGQTELAHATWTGAKCHCELAKHLLVLYIRWCQGLVARVSLFLFIFFVRVAIPPGKEL